MTVGAGPEQNQANNFTMKLDGTGLSQAVFEQMILDFIDKDCNGHITLNRLKGRFVENKILDQTIRKLRAEKKIIPTRAFAPTGDLIRCFTVAKRH